MDIGSWLKEATTQLEKAGVATARLDALVLLEDQLSTNRAYLLAHPERTLSTSDINVLNQKLSQRSLHMPLVYIRGKTEFYGRDFIITPAVLEPRPESETMIDLLKTLYQGESLASSKTVPSRLSSQVRIADVGSGSGAIGITAKLELPDTSVDLLELDESALEVSKMNVVKHTININVIKSDLLSGSDNNYEILLCNLPYVPDDFHINTAANHEPEIAIFGGPDGLEIYRQLFRDLQKTQHKPLYILTESLPTQHAQLHEIAAKSGYKLQATDDFIQVYISAHQQ